jgi:hypothetical protein
MVIRAVSPRRGTYSSHLRMECELRLRSQHGPGLQGVHNVGDLRHATLIVEATQIVPFGGPCVSSQGR